MTERAQRLWLANIGKVVPNFEQEVECTSCECVIGPEVASSEWVVTEEFFGVSWTLWAEGDCEFGSKWLICVLGVFCNNGIISTIGISLLVSWVSFITAADPSGLGGSKHLFSSTCELC